MILFEHVTCYFCQLQLNKEFHVLLVYRIKELTVRRSEL